MTDKVADYWWQVVLRAQINTGEVNYAEAVIKTELYRNRHESNWTIKLRSSTICSQDFRGCIK